MAPCHNTAGPMQGPAHSMGVPMEEGATDIDSRQMIHCHPKASTPAGHHTSNKRKMILPSTMTILDEDDDDSATNNLNTTSSSYLDNHCRALAEWRRRGRSRSWGRSGGSGSRGRTRGAHSDDDDQYPVTPRLRRIKMIQSRWLQFVPSITWQFC